ncbi:MAG: glycine cleavage system aminomethyltransferase GcvT [Sedimentisphaerales bacterium]|nr:glycine cleavage system aminomethyltransferase GcvT [Sedimentisphaerales bacterium]
MAKSDNLGHFSFKNNEKTAVGSVLYNEHLRLIEKNRFAEFAGYLMPLWFSSISAEHNAVRESAGLFDCTHMGILEFAGKNARDFLNIIATNDTGKLKTGSAQYNYILDAAGNVLDDIIIYRLSEDKYMVVVNAANEPKIKAYLEALINNDAIVDIEKPQRKLDYKPAIRDMRDPNNGTDCRVDIALQGPKSMVLLLSMISKEKDREQLENLKSFHLFETELDGYDCIISRTGYTGAKIGFELFVHPEKAADLWSLLLEKGKSLGIIPCGLGARDSLRIEAGLPLYGHELAGEFNINPFEAGYGWAVKLEKEFFIGQAAMRKKAEARNMQVARIELPGQKGIRPARSHDGILDENGLCVGWVLSCAGVSDKQIALVYISSKTIERNPPLGLYYLARSKGQIEKGKKDKARKNEKLEPDIPGKIIERFAKF